MPPEVDKVSARLPLCRPASVSVTCEECGMASHHRACASSNNAAARTSSQTQQTAVDSHSTGRQARLQVAVCNDGYETS